MINNFRQKVGFSRFFIFAIWTTNSRTNSNPIFASSILCQKVRKTTVFELKAVVFMVAEAGLVFSLWRVFTKNVLRISPFAVPDKIFGLTHFLDFIDRGTHCALPSSATGGGRARDPTSCARRSHNPEVGQGLLCKLEKKKRPLVWVVFSFSGASVHNGLDLN